MHGGQNEARFFPIQKKTFECIKSERTDTKALMFGRSGCAARHVHLNAQKTVQHMKKNKSKQLNQNKRFNKTISRLRNNTHLYCSAEGL